MSQCVKQVGSGIVKEVDGVKEILNDKKNCVICLGMVGVKNSSTTKCGHTFCLTCLHENLKISNRCPCCRKKILKQKPEKPLAKLNKKLAIQMIKQETRGWDWDLMIESYTSFPAHSRITLQSDLQRFGLELTKRFMVFQINGDENDIYDSSDNDSDDDTQDEPQEYIVDTDDDDDDDDE
tara:strand:- start:69 stop:608 length:540 start_codon:yes stop_codon:yes gene_type:complete